MDENKTNFENYIKLEAERVKFYNEDNEYDTEYPEEKDNEIYDALSKITYDEYLENYAYGELSLKDILGNDYFIDSRCWSYLSDSIDSMFSSHDFIKDEKNYTYLFPDNFINSVSDLIGYGSLEYIGNYKFSDLGPCQVITGKKHDLMELAYDNSYKLNPQCLYEKENLNLEDAEKIKGLKIPKDDKKYKGKSFYEWAKSDAEDPRHLEYTIQVEGKDTASFDDVKAYISPSGMNLLRNSSFVNAEYSDDKIKVTVDFDKESYELFHDEFLKTNNFDCNIQKEEVTRIAFRGIDSWNRPVFGEVIKNENGKDVWGKHYFGVTSPLYSRGEENKAIEELKGKEKDFIYFGKYFDCEPDGNTPWTKLQIDLDLSKKICAAKAYLISDKESYINSIKELTDKEYHYVELNENNNPNKILPYDEYKTILNSKNNTDNSKFFIEINDKWNQFYIRPYEEFMKETYGNINIINKNNKEISKDNKLTQEDIELCRQVIPDNQFAYTMDLISYSEEKDFYIDKFKEIADICRERTFSEPKEDGMPAFHYFRGNTHIYISELYEGNEKGKCDGYAFGYTILNGDLQMSEWGDSSLKEIKSIPSMEIDYYFDRSKKIDDILKENYPSYFKKLDEKEKELENQKTFLESSNETFCDSVNNLDKTARISELENKLSVPEEKTEDFIKTIDSNTKNITSNAENKIENKNHKGRK